MTFQELAKLTNEMLSKQRLITL